MSVSTDTIKVIDTNEIQKDKKTIQAQKKAEIDKKLEITTKQLEEAEKKLSKFFIFKKDENEVQNIPKSDNYLKNLKELRYSNKRVDYINTRLMQTCKSLETVDLSSNQIKELHKDTFQQCSKLEIVSLNSNHIEELHPETFQNCSKLKSVNLSSNKIKLIEPETFKKVANPSEINFSSNFIKELHQDLFQTCSKLREIIFASNQIEELHPDSFQQCKNLQHIDFSYNSIRHINPNTFAPCERLVTIYFGFNRIKKLHEKTFRECKKLRNINFGNNEITELHENLFKTNSEIFSIDFTSNQIKELHPDTFSNCKELEEIYFDQNHIRKLDKDTFSDCPKLNQINFVSNQIAELDPDTFKNCKHIKSIAFDSNQIKTLDLVLSFDKESMCKFSFSNNFIQRFPENFLTENIQVDFRNNLKILDVKKIVSNLILKRDTELKLSLDNIENFQTKNHINVPFNKKLSLDLLQEKYQTFLFRSQDLRFLKEFFFLLFFNKSIFTLNEHSYEEIDKNFKSNFKKFKLFEWSLLDFLIFYAKYLGAQNLINLNSYIKYELRQNQETFVNLDFKFRSGESVKTLCVFNDINLFKTFFADDLNIENINSTNDDCRIFDYETFYKSVNFKECFETVIKNENEEIAIELIKILSHSIHDLKLNILDTRPNDKFNVFFLNFVLVKFFEKEWWDAISFYLDTLHKHLLENDKFEPFINFDLEDFVSKKDKKKRVRHLDTDEELIYEEENHILQLIIKMKDKVKRNFFLKNSFIKILIDHYWRYKFRFYYYLYLIYLIIFLIFYSINIEIYARTEKSSGLNVTCKCICFLMLYILIVNEFYELIHDKKKYIKSFKNLVELFNFPLCVVALICDLSSSDIHLKSSLYSISILGAYFTLAYNLNKIPKIGIYIDVIGQILKKSISILLFLLIALIAFILAFRNRSKFYESENSESNSVNQMSYFNTTFEFNLFQVAAFSLGGLSTENMGIEYINEKTLVNYIIYGCFIFFMPIMFLNIFQSISIDEIGKLYEESEAKEIITKIEYAFFLRATYTFIGYGPNLYGYSKNKKNKTNENRPNRTESNSYDFLSRNIEKHLTTKTDSIENNMEKNFAEINNRIMRLENMMESKVILEEKKRTREAWKE
jgi:Leucine-rich repeat (LRR) protein